MALSDSDFIKLNLPDGVSFEKNGATMSVDDVIAAVLAMDSVAGVKELALAELFAMLESDQFRSETAKGYSYQRWGIKGSEYWRQRALAVKATGSAPTVVMRPRGYHSYGPWGCVP